MMIIRMLVLPLALAFLPLMSSAQEPRSDTASFMQEIKRLEQEYGGHLGFAAKNLATGEVVRYRGGERFPTASVIKLPVMAAFFHLVDQKAADPNHRITLRVDDVKSGSTFLENVSPGLSLTVLDAVKMMIIVSDNAATNLVVENLGPNHEARLRAVNDFLDAKGLRDIRFLNPPGSFKTKQRTPDATRYGIGVSTPDDMAALLEAIYRRTLVDSASCSAMIDIMKQLPDKDMLPRFLPAAGCQSLDVAHKTGSIQEVKADVGLVLSDRVKFAIAVFVDKHPDHRDEVQNRAVLLVAHVARAVWNHFTGDRGYERPVTQGHVDWTSIPGGEWAIYRTSAAPFPHKDRMSGLRTEDGTFFPLFPHYLDSSVVVFVPNGFKETERGTNLIVHFHGWMNDNLKVLHRSEMFQTLVDQKVNALLVLPQGPYFADDSFCGKMEDAGGFRRLVEDVLTTMKREGIVKSEKIGNIIVSGHSGGFRPAAFVLDRGGASDHVTDVFLFDAFYSQQDKFKSWLLGNQGHLFGCYTEYLAKECTGFEKEMKPRVGDRLQFTKTTVPHDDVVQAFFPQWMRTLGSEWKQ